MKDDNPKLLECYFRFSNDKEGIIDAFNNKNHGDFFDKSIYGLAIAYNLLYPEGNEKDKSDFLREINATMMTAIDYGKIKIDGTIG